MNKIVKDTLILFAITLVAGVLLGFVYKVTEGPIAEQNEKIKLAAYNALFDTLDSYEVLSDDVLSTAQNIVDSKYSGVTVDEIVTAMDSNGSLLGYIIGITDAEGYGGDISFSVGISIDGAITGLEILSISETAGLGMKAKEESFRSQYIGISEFPITYSKTGKSASNEIDALSGATITTKAITGGVNAAGSVYEYISSGQADDQTITLDSEAKGGDLDE